MGRGTVSTVAGQNRILKQPMDLISYIQKAVKAGVYRTQEEIEEMNGQLRESPADIRHVRWNVHRGSNIQDYPLEYEVMTLNPPLPFQPRMPIKDRRKIVSKYIREKRPTDSLVQKYLHRMERAENHSHGDDSEDYSDGGPVSSEDYYRRLLGSQHLPKVDSAMGAKSAVLNKAYAVAVKQYMLMRTEQLSESEALERVEELLKQEDKTERTTSRAKAEDLVAKRTNLRSKTSDTRDVVQEASQLFGTSRERVKEASKRSNDAGLQMLYSDRQRAFEGMISWTQRLQAVPYAQWTVGASVALDHWIAIRVLGLSEETWLALLEGDDPNLISRGRDIIMARHALFPETILDAELEAEKLSQEEEEEEDSDRSSIDDDINRLLATLSGWNKNKDEKDTKSSITGTSKWQPEIDVESRDEKVLKLTKELQEWRSRQQQSPYEDWPEEQKSEFGVSANFEFISSL